MEEINKIQRVRVEPERTGWARLYDLVRQVDKDRVADVKEDIDTLLVFVRVVLRSLYNLRNSMTIGRFIFRCHHRIHRRVV